MDELISKLFIQDSNTPATHRDHKSKLDFAVTKSNKSLFWETYLLDLEKGDLSISELIAGDKAPRQFSIGLRFVFSRVSLSEEEKTAYKHVIESIDEYILKVIGVIQRVLKNTTEINADNAEYTCAYLRRTKEPILDEKSHLLFDASLVFPYCRITPKQAETIFQNFHSMIMLYHPITSLNPEPINPPAEVIKLADPNVRLLYGSGLNSIEPYKLQGLYTWGDNAAIKIDLPNVFVPTLHPSYTELKQAGRNLEYFIPLLFSHDYAATRVTTVKGILERSPISSRSSHSEDSPSIDPSIGHERSDEEELMIRARTYMRYIKPSRGEHTWSWLDIGTSLYSLPDKSEALDMWKAFSAKTGAFLPEQCDEKWGDFEHSEGITIETLRYFAYLDNRAAYDKYTSKRKIELLDQAIKNCTHTSVANAFVEYFPFEFICSNYKQSVWYHYTGTRWARMDGESKIVQYLEGSFMNIIKKQLSLLHDSRADYEDKDVKYDTGKHAKNIGKLIQKLESVGFKTSVANDLRSKYHRPDFERLKDGRPYFTGVPNGVIDVRDGTAVLRHGKPEDFITKSTAAKIDVNATKDTPYVREYYKYLRQVFPDKKIRYYMRMLIASLLIGGNLDKVWPIFTGEGDNSKSVFINILGVFRDYIRRISTAFLSEKRQSSDSANPALVRAHGARLLICQEPNARDPINSGPVKEITGNDVLGVRDLYEKGCDIIERLVTFIFVLVCNRTPPLPDAQMAIWNRVRKIPFESQWVPAELAPKDFKEQMEKKTFPIDRSIDGRIAILGMGCLWLAFHDYKSYAKHGLPVVPKIMKDTEDFRVKNNVYLHFKKDRLKEHPIEGGWDPTIHTTIKAMYSTFKTWYGGRYTAYAPTIIEFQDNITAVLRRQPDEDGRWDGLSIKEDELTDGTGF